MAKVQLQFHAEPAELLELMRAWSGAGGYGLAAEQFFPAYDVICVATDGPPLDGLGLARVDRLALTLEAPVAGASSEQEFAVANRDALYAHVGALNGEGLRESALGGVCGDRGVLRRWRATVKAAKAAMHAGATVRNPVTGHAARAPSHLHTSGAHRLAEDGVVMLALAGWNEFEFDDLHPQTR